MHVENDRMNENTMNQSGTMSHNTDMGQNSSMSGGMGSSASQGYTGDLIASNMVEGTAVYSHDGDKLGSISHFMVSKKGGKVNYAVMSFGGFLGMGTDEYTMPWEKLQYDESKGGYVVDVTKDQLDQAPRYNANSQNDREYYEGVNSYYGISAASW
jgi:hypothetical protein